MNPFDPDIFSAENPCVCCAPPADCSCALLIPPQASPYVDYATADGVIADPLLVADCLAYNDVSLDMTSFSAAFDGTTFTADGAWSSAVSSFGYVWISISAKSGATLTFDSTAGSSFDGVIYTCDGTEVEVIGPAATPITSAALPADGEYYLKMLPNDPPMGSGPFTACTITVTSSDTFWVNPVIALWDDSGTTRKLWACPKLLLPIGTESSGTWYASCADAATAITDNTSNCVGYQEPFPGFGSFTATDGGSSLTLATVMSPDGFATGTAYGGINAEAGETITATITEDGVGTDQSIMDIYDDTGALVETVNGPAPLVSSALPYTGRYTVAVAVIIDNTGTPFTNASAVITSSGTMSVNEIQALWDNGLTCPSRLDCGDSC